MFDDAFDAYPRKRHIYHAHSLITTLYLKRKQRSSQHPAPYPIHKERTIVSTHHLDAKTISQYHRIITTRGVCLCGGPGISPCYSHIRKICVNCLEHQSICVCEVLCTSRYMMAVILHVVVVEVCLSMFVYSRVPAGANPLYMSQAGVGDGRRKLPNIGCW